MLLKELYEILEAALSNISQRQAKWDEEARLKGSRHKKWDQEYQQKKDIQAGKLSPSAEQVLIFARKNPKYINQIIDMLMGVKNAAQQMESASLLEQVNQDAKMTPKEVMRLWNEKGKPRELYSVATFLKNHLGFDDDQIKRMMSQIGIGYDPKYAPQQEPTSKPYDNANKAAPEGSQRGAVGEGMPPELQKQAAELISKVNRSEKRNLLAKLKDWLQREKDVAGRKLGQAGIITSPRG